MKVEIEGDRVRVEGGECSVGEFLETALNVLTAADVAIDDPRHRFVATVKSLQLAPGYERGKHRLKRV